MFGRYRPVGVGLVTEREGHAGLVLVSCWRPEEASGQC